MMYMICISYIHTYIFVYIYITYYTYIVASVSLRRSSCLQPHPCPSRGPLGAAHRPPSGLRGGPEGRAGAVPRVGGGGATVGGRQPRAPPPRHLPPHVPPAAARRWREVRVPVHFLLEGGGGRWSIGSLTVGVWWGAKVGRVYHWLNRSLPKISSGVDLRQRYHGQLKHQCAHPSLFPLARTPHPNAD